MEEKQYVSRGGLKIEKALKVFNINVKNLLALDIGASTGGFTDCMLQNGARKVYAVDVGYGQLHWKLQQDPRVVRMDRINARYLTKENFPDENYFDITTIDVSFISLEKILPAIRDLVAREGIIIALVKPQFEVGRGKVGGKGVVRKPELHLDVLVKLIRFSVMLGFQIENLTYSPITGPEGNIEYFLHLTNHQLMDSEFTWSKVDEVVNSAWQELKNVKRD